MNSHAFWSTYECKGKEGTQVLGDAVVNQHQEMCVKVYLTDIRAIKPKRHGN